MRVTPSQVRTGPERRLVRAPELVHCRALDGVIFTGPVLDGEDPGEPLLVERIGALTRVWLAGLGLGLGAGHVLDAPKLEQVSQLCGIQDVVGRDGQGLAGRARQRHRAHAVTIGRHVRGVVPTPQREISRRLERGEQVIDHLHRDTGFVGQTAHPCVSGIEVGVALRLTDQRVVAAVVVADGAAERAIRCGRPKHLDPGMLVGRHPLGGELPAQAIMPGGQNHPVPPPPCCEGRGHAAETAANNEHLGVILHVTVPWALSATPSCAPRHCARRRCRRGARRPPSQSPAQSRRRRIPESGICLPGKIAQR